MNYRFFYKLTPISKNIHRHVVECAENEQCAITRFRHYFPKVTIVSIDTV